MQVVGVVTNTYCKVEGFTRAQRERFSQLIKEELTKAGFVINEGWKETKGDDVHQAQVRASKRFIVEGMTYHPVFLKAEKDVNASDIVLTFNNEKNLVNPKMS